MGKSCQIYVKDLLFSFNTQWLCFDFTFVIESTIKKETFSNRLWILLKQSVFSVNKTKIKITIIIGLLVIGFNKNIGIQRKMKKN